MKLQPEVFGFEIDMGSFELQPSAIDTTAPIPIGTDTSAFLTNCGYDNYRFFIYGDFK